MLVDCHTHAFAEKIAEKAVAQLINYYHIETTLGGRLVDLLESAVTAGLDAMILLVAATRPEQVKPANDWALFLNSLSGDDLKKEYHYDSLPRIVPFGTFHPDDPNWFDEISRLRKAGVKGIKLHPEFQGIDLADPRLLNFFAEIENDFILMVHIGDPVVSESNNSTPQKVADILDHFPKLRIIAAHMGGYQFWDQAYRILAGRDLYLDTSSTLEYIDPGLLQKIFERHDPEKILFGSDYPLRSPVQELALIKKLNWLTSTQKERIIGQNCVKLLGI